MKIAVWVVFAVLTGLWTGFVAVSVELVAWAVAAVGSGGVGELASGAAGWQVPAWLALWVDPASVQALQASGLALVQWLGEMSPNLGGVMAWLAPLMWIGWGAVAFLMLAAAVALHWLVGRLKKPSNLQRVAA
ncbi:MAG: hypothetical protein WEK74_08005 [Hydrogenophaga sp.]